MGERDRINKDTESVEETLSSHERFINEIISPNIRSDRVFEAFQAIDRADFVPPDIDVDPYSDEVIRITNDASISKPSLVAKMVDYLDPQETDNILEVGTASGYNAAVLSKCSRSVVTIEVDEDLGVQARTRLEELGISAKVLLGDALQLDQDHKYDKIIVTASVREIPSALIKLLKPHGRMITPVGPDDPTQSDLILGQVNDGIVKTRKIGDVAFVPLISPEEGGWSVEELSTLNKQPTTLEEMLIQNTLDEENMTEEELIEKAKGYFEISKVLTEEQLGEIKLAFAMIKRLQRKVQGNLKKISELNILVRQLLNEE